MNRQDIAEIRRRIDPERLNTDLIRGCYVDAKGNIISEFSRSLLTIPQEEAVKYLAFFKKVLSGVPGRNLVGIGFDPDQVMSGEEHRLLTSMRATALKVDQAVEAFYQKVIDSLDLESNYLILLMHDSYDVPFHAKDENRVDEYSEDVFSYFICAICPVKLGKEGLSYDSGDKTFHEQIAEWVVGVPELGFMFPAFEEGGANIYTAMYYTRDTKESYPGFTDAVFGSLSPKPAAEQKEIFNSILGDTLGNDCRLEVVQTVHDQLRDMIEERKADKTADPAGVSKQEVSRMLTSCGVSEGHVAAFEERFDDEFGPTVELCARTVTNTNSFELKTPDVVVKVKPERSDLIETRVIDGSRYILIRADEGVEVNGVRITIDDLGEEVE